MNAETLFYVLVPTLRVGMPSPTLRVDWPPNKNAGRRASKKAFPRRAWERVKYSIDGWSFRRANDAKNAN